MRNCDVQRAKLLRHSDVNTAEGDFLKRICYERDLKQLIDKPTRRDYFLDLVLTGLENWKAQIVAPIADYHGMIARTALPCPKAHCVSREMWHFKGAAWLNLKCALRN